MGKCRNGRWANFLPVGFTVDSQGNVFIADYYMDILTYFTTYYIKFRIQKFSSEGNLVEKWETSGNLMELELDFILSFWGGTIAVDNEDNLCFLSFYPPLAQKILTDGEFNAGWEYVNLEEDPIPITTGLAIDGEDAVYIVFAYPGYIKKYTSEGEFVTKWDLSLSTPVGQFSINTIDGRLLQIAKERSIM